MDFKKQVEQNKNEYLNRLIDLLKINSMEVYTNGKKRTALRGKGQKGLCYR